MASIDPPKPHSMPDLWKSGLRRPLLAGGALLWFCLILLGARVLLRYENTPGPGGVAPASWPASSRIRRPQKKFALVMLAHPNCPCSRASLAELDRLLPRVSEKLAAYVVFAKPGSSAAEVEQSDLWRKASGIPGVSVIRDANGMEVERFGASTSGQTFLYNPEGKLVFSGGITIGRGHEGDNDGVDAVIRLVNGEAVASSRTSVFGCALHDPAAQLRREDPSWTKP